MTKQDHNYGATPEDWAHFDLVLGLTSDLLPVVSDPDAKISPDSKVKQPGKVPTEYNRKGELRGLASWAERVTTPDEIATWARNGNIGICLQTREVRAIDVDIEDWDESEEVGDFIAKYLGMLMPRRHRRNSCKFLLAIRLPGAYSKRRFKTQTGVIEFLATGQQFVAVGTHPSGSKYEWADGLPNSIPYLSDDEFEGLWAALNARFGTEDSVERKNGQKPETARRAADIDDPVVAFLEDRWDVFDITARGRVDLRCPWEHEHTTESDESATSYFPAGVGGFVRGHFVCQHSHCAHRTIGDFLDAVGYMTNGFELVPVEINQRLPQLHAGVSAIMSRARRQVRTLLVPEALRTAKYVTTTKAGDSQVRVDRETLHIALTHPEETGIGFGHDLFLGEHVLIDSAGPRSLRDSDVHETAMAFERAGFAPINHEIMRRAIDLACDTCEFDPMQEWINSLQWDGVPRVRTFLANYMGAHDNDYTRAVSEYMWTAIAGRIITPGVQADMAVVVIGPQGARKTSIIRALAPRPDAFAEVDISTKDADLARQTRGKIIVELGEMKGIGGLSLEHTKSFMTRREEKWIPKYKEFEVSYPRRFIMIASTNDRSTPLPEDPTGHRRWLPFTMREGVSCRPEDIDEIREQLYAEAAAMYREGGVRFQEAERLAPAEHVMYSTTDPWKSTFYAKLIVQAADDPMIAPLDSEGITTEQAVEYALGILPRDITRAHIRRAASCLEDLGFAKRRKTHGYRWVLTRKPH